MLSCEDIYEDLARDVEKRIDTSNYELERLLSKEKNKKKKSSVNETWIRWKNKKIICGIKNKSI